MNDPLDPRLLDQSFQVAIADILIEVTSSLSAAELGVEDRLGAFFGRPEHPIASLSLRCDLVSVPPPSSGQNDL